MRFQRDSYSFLQFGRAYQTQPLIFALKNYLYGQPPNSVNAEVADVKAKRRVVEQEENEEEEEEEEYDDDYDEDEYYNEVSYKNICIFSHLL